MNVHDSERIKGLLESLGLGEAATPDDADFLVFNTCTIREKADDRLVAHLMDARAAKQRDPGKVIVVGGCWSESMKDELFEQYPFVDLAFGPGNIHRLGDFIQAGGEIPRGHFSTFDSFAGELPLKRDRAAPGLAADLDRLQLQLRLLHRARACAGASTAATPTTWCARPTALAADGVRELTLLGQNVNSYGRDLRPAVATSFAALLRALDAVARHRADPLHEPAPEGHARRRDRRDGRVRRPCASTCTCPSSRARPACSRRCAAPTRASATWRWSSASAPRSRTSR